MPAGGRGRWEDGEESNGRWEDGRAEQNLAGKSQFTPQIEDEGIKRQWGIEIERNVWFQALVCTRSLWVFCSRHQSAAVALSELFVKGPTDWLTDGKCLWVWQWPVSLTASPHLFLPLLRCHSEHLICIRGWFSVPLVQPFTIRPIATHQCLGRRKRRTGQQIAKHCFCALQCGL